MVAFGACASWGGIPGMANVTDREGIFEAVYGYTASTKNPDRVRPTPKLKVPEGEVTIPEMFNDVFALNQVVPVEYYVPGCPPTPETVMTAVNAIVSGALPPPGAVIGGTKSVCDECKKTKSEKPKVAAYRRPQEFIPDPEKCLLEQGLVCMGSATRSGCGALCTTVNMTCRGCYGPMPNAKDAGADCLAAVTSILEATDAKEVAEKVGQLADPMGTFYRFTLPVSMLGRKSRTT